MQLTIKSNIHEVIRNVRQYQGNQLRSFGYSLYELCAMIAGDSIKLTPWTTGNLRGSLKIYEGRHVAFSVVPRLSPRGGAEQKIRLNRYGPMIRGRGALSPTLRLIYETDYAFWVHEIREYYHPIGTAKFLALTADKYQRFISPAFRDTVKNAFIPPKSGLWRPIVARSRRR